MKTTEILFGFLFLIFTLALKAQDTNHDVEIRISAAGGVNQILTSSEGLDESFLNGFESLGFGFELAASIKKDYAGLSFRVGRSVNPSIPSNWINESSMEATSIDDLVLKKFGADLNFYLDLADRFDLEIVIGYLLNFGEDIDYRFDEIVIPEYGRVHTIQSAQTRLGMSGLYKLTDRLNLGLTTEVLTGKLNYQTDTIFGRNLFNEGAYDDPMLNWNFSLMIAYKL